MNLPKRQEQLRELVEELDAMYTRLGVYTQVWHLSRLMEELMVTKLDVEEYVDENTQLRIASN